MSEGRRKLRKQLEEMSAKRPQVAFSLETLESLAHSLKTGLMKTDRVTLSDDMVPGLRAIIRDTGLISFHVQYSIGKSRPYLKIGDVPGMSVEEARKLARTILELARQGIDPQSGLHERLIRELTEQGANWRP